MSRVFNAIGEIGLRLFNGARDKIAGDDSAEEKQTAAADAAASEKSKENEEKLK